MCDPISYQKILGRTLTPSCAHHDTNLYCCIKCCISMCNGVKNGVVFATPFVGYQFIVSIASSPLLSL